VANLAAGTLTEISERAGTVLAPAIKAGSGLAAVAVSPDQARPRRGIVWTVGSFLPFTFREFSEADTPARLTAAGPADVAGVPYTLAVDAVNGQVYEGTSEGLSPFLPTPPVLTATDLFWWTNVPSADSAPATPAVFFPPPRFSIAGAPSWVHVDPISGTLHGLPGKTGKFSFTVFARNTLGLGSAARFTVTVGVAPVFRSPPSATFVAGLKSAFQMVVTGVPKPAVQLPGPGTLPAGLTFTSAGLLSGTPAAGTEGTYQFFAAASNDPTLAIVVVQQFTLTVVRGRAPTFISPAHARLRAGEHAVVTIRTSGVPVPKVKVTGRLPRGLAVRPGKPGTAVIAGRPARSDAHHRFRIKTTAVNGLGHVTRTLVITVSPPAKRDRPIRARLTAHVTRLPGWEARLLRSLPASLRGRALRTLSERPGTAGCISVAGQSEHGQAWIAGYANVTKLRGAALVGPAFADIVALTKEVICPRSVTEFSTEVPSFRGKPEFPPMRATFLAFGFIPVTATIQISQVGVGHILLTLAGAVSATPPYIVQAKARLSIRVMTVKVNGVALPVGARCRTMSPGAATLNNVNPTGLPGRNFWDTFTGGPLSGTITVPRFAGCGASGDDLDAILDASISGPGNFSKLIQGMPCIFGNLFDTTCPPQVPEPRR
jgi:hypothetical protein